MARIIYQRFMDCQAFNDNDGSYIFKEVAVAMVTEEFDLQFRHWMVRSPFPLRCLDSKRRTQVTYLQRRHHGITWNDGDVDLVSIVSELSPHLTGRPVYVMGREKAKELGNVFDGRFFHLATFPSLKELEPVDKRCRFHENNSFQCSLNNVAKIVQHYFNG